MSFDINVFDLGAFGSWFDVVWNRLSWIRQSTNPDQQLLEGLFHSRMAEALTFADCIRTGSDGGVRGLLRHTMVAHSATEYCRQLDVKINDLIVAKLETLLGGENFDLKWQEEGLSYGDWSKLVDWKEDALPLIPADGPERSRFLGVLEQTKSVQLLVHWLASLLEKLVREQNAPHGVDSALLAWIRTNGDFCKSLTVAVLSNPKIQSDNAFMTLVDNARLVDAPANALSDAEFSAIFPLL